MLPFDSTVQALRIAHVITDLNGFGGTEATLLRYLQRGNNKKFNHRVIVLNTIGECNTLGDQMVRSGIEVVALKLSSGSISFRGLAQLYISLREFKPDVISGWLYHPSLLATVLAPWLIHKPAVVWHIRSLPFADAFKNTSRFVVQRLLAALSRFTRPVLVSNAAAAIEAHRAIGFRREHDRWVIIPNGLDAEQYFPDKHDGLAVRRDLNIPDDALIIGCVGRFVPEKGYAIMFDALAKVYRKLQPEIAPNVSNQYNLTTNNLITQRRDRGTRRCPAQARPASRHQKSRHDHFEPNPDESIDLTTTENGSNEQISFHRLAPGIEQTVEISTLHKPQRRE